MAPAPDRLTLPEFCARGRLLAAIAAGQLVILTIALAPTRAPRWDFTEFASASALATWIAIASALALCKSRPWLMRLPPRIDFVVATAVPMGVALLGAGSLSYIAATIGGFILDADRDRHFVLATVGLTGLIAAIATRYFAAEDRWRAQVEAVSQAQMEALQARIRPHFLFNSMNSIAALVRRDPAAAEQAVEDLSELFRAALGQGVGADTLAGEIHLAQRFLGIEQLRLGDRLRVRWDSAPDLPLDLSMPRLVLQPLLENAVVHGVARLPEGGEITVALRVEGGRLRVEVANPYPVDVPGRPGNGHALASIRQRLEHRFGRGVGMTASAERGYYRVRLDLPMPAA
ncbi:MAG: histidine kinase [Xanthomonadaceae bacterium]|jgi:two-component system sensor histidine kinase AlgZ|nr:histidine kinase [Xanthomonadaceae bacterium]MCZ8318543.1 histidine kinase [Silanimonas sp.]